MDAPEGTVGMDPVPPMHDDEHPIDLDLVRRLLRSSRARDAGWQRLGVTQLRSGQIANVEKRSCGTASSGRRRCRRALG